MSLIDGTSRFVKNFFVFVLRELVCQLPLTLTIYFQGKLIEREGRSTVDLLIKAACFLNKSLGKAVDLIHSVRSISKENYLREGAVQLASSLRLLVL
jgi:hypothetical protein